MSLKSQITNHLKAQYPDIIHKGELGRLAMNEWGYENENMGRRCRELVEEGIIKMIPDEKRRAQYQWIPLPEWKPIVSPTSVQAVLFKPAYE